METEVPEMLRRRESIIPDERFTFHSARMRLAKVTPEELRAMNAETGRCATELIDARVDALSTACLVAIMAQGPGYHRKVERELTELIDEVGTSSEVVTSAGALVNGLRGLDAKRISILTPYMKPLTAQVVDYLEAEGFEVRDALSLEIPDNLEVGRRDAMLLVEDVRRLDTQGVDAIVLSACVQLPSLQAVPIVENETGLPVVTAATCTVRDILSSLGLAPEVPDAGVALRTADHVEKAR
ncbi:maleate cis-trans isomerase family protein [Nitriliruptor alkaliphilus]|uniref:maleate cis-trans isomerase family protein n=1 Tax=Nitriliruptor alkaliphilus TaxID=427918 RepID=UPI001FE22F58|nr:Asp/Glu racemase [Nitriliruptor alkaliphilus]